MSTKITRRDFLKLGAFSTAGLALGRFADLNPGMLSNEDMVRIAHPSVSVYSHPSDDSPIVYTRYRDDLLNVYYKLVSPDGPDYNPVWYRVWRGYIHSAHLQSVRNRLNPITYNIPKSGMLTEVTVPYTQSMRLVKRQGWEKLYRLYYGSTHWVVGIDTGPDGQPWYKIEDEIDGFYIYYVPAEHLRPVLPEEYTPLSPDIPPEKKRIEVSLFHQRLTAYEYDKIVLQTKISSGLPSYGLPAGAVPTETPIGTYHMQIKMPSKHMGDGNITSDLEAYELPGVPWVSFFEPENGVACHGTYWHTNYGNKMSHGCINMTNDQAKWLFRWTTPVAEFGAWQTPGYGTRIDIS